MMRWCDRDIVYVFNAFDDHPYQPIEFWFGSTIVLWCIIIINLMWCLMLQMCYSVNHSPG